MKWKSWKERVRNEIGVRRTELDKVEKPLKEIGDIEWRFEQEFYKNNEDSEQKLKEILDSLEKKIEEFLYVMSATSGKFAVEPWMVRADYEYRAAIMVDRRDFLSKGRDLKDIARLGGI